MDNLKLKNEQIASIKRLKSLTIGQEERHELTDKDDRHNRWLKILFFVLCFIVVFGLVLVNLNQFGNAIEVSSINNPSVDQPNAYVVPEAPKTKANQIVATGFVVARQRATIASEVTGRLVELKYKEGDLVKEGEVIAILDSSLLVAERSSILSRIESSESSIAILKEELKDTEQIQIRQQKLFNSNLIPESTNLSNKAKVDILRIRVNKAVADTEAIKSELAFLDARIARYQIKSPFTATIVDENANPGEIVSPVSAGGGFTRTGIYTLVNMQSLYIEASLNEGEYSNVQIGGSVTIRFDAFPQQSFKGEVLSLVPRVNKETAAIKIDVAILDNVEGLLPDMSVQLELQTKESNL